MGFPYFFSKTEHALFKQRIGISQGFDEKVEYIMYVNYSLFFSSRVVFAVSAYRSERGFERHVPQVGTS